MDKLAKTCLLLLLCIILVSSFVTASVGITPIEKQPNLMGAVDQEASSHTMTNPNSLVYCSNQYLKSRLRID